MRTSEINQKEAAAKRMAVRRRRKIRKRLLLAVSVVALALVTVISTRAYLSKTTDPVTNNLVAGSVETSVDENFDKTTKTDVSVANTGNVTAYIRAKVIVNWMSEDGNSVYGTSPAEDTDYTISYSEDTSWQQGEDGFWYYTKPVEAEEKTAVLIKKAALSKGATPPAGYYLSVEIAASALQSLPVTTVSDVWSSGVQGVGSDGTLQVK